MKKNKALTAAISVLSLTMVSMCAIGGTFAKYATGNNATDTAKVAKWGVTVNVDSYGAFATSHTESGSGSASVQSSTSDNVLAPGTDGILVNATISGTPEVSAEVTYVAELTLSNWKGASAQDYCPLVFNVGSTKIKWGSAEAADDNTDDNDTINSVAELEKAVEAAIGAAGATYNPRDSITDTLSVSWSWDIGTSNVDDTALGNAAADGDAGNDPTISLKVTTTVTQLD